MIFPDEVKKNSRRAEEGRAILRKVRVGWIKSQRDGSTNRFELASDGEFIVDPLRLIHPTVRNDRQMI